MYSDWSTQFYVDEKTYACSFTPGLSLREVARQLLLRYPALRLHKLAFFNYDKSEVEDEALDKTLGEIFANNKEIVETAEFSIYRGSSMEDFHTYVLLKKVN